MLTLETVAVIGGMASISASAHAVGVGFVADVVMVGGGVVCFGAEAWRAGKEFLLFWKTATAAAKRGVGRNRDYDGNKSTDSLSETENCQRQITLHYDKRWWEIFSSVDALEIDRRFLV